MDVNSLLIYQGSSNNNLSKNNMLTYNGQLQDVYFEIVKSLNTTEIIRMKML